MSSLYAAQARNTRLTFFLMSVFLIIVIGISWLAAVYFESPFILIVAVSMALLMNVGAYWKSDKIAISLTGAKEITRKEYFDYFNLVENLCISIGAKMPKLYIIDDRSPNAFATGRNEENSAIVVTKGLLDIMDKNELEGVLAHELAHIQNKDTLLMTSVVVLFGIVALLLDFLIRVSLFSTDKKHPIFFVFIIVAYILAPIILTIIKMSISRKREFLADSTAGVYTRYPEGLASALEKIKNYHQPLERASSATAHLFISDPFHAVDKKSKKRSKLLGLFDTHPPIDDRIKALSGK